MDDSGRREKLRDPSGITIVFLDENRKEARYEKMFYQDGKPCTGDGLLPA